MPYIVKQSQWFQRIIKQSPIVTTLTVFPPIGDISAQWNTKYYSISACTSGTRSPDLVKPTPSSESSQHFNLFSDSSNPINEDPSDPTHFQVPLLLFPHIWKFQLVPMVICPSKQRMSTAQIYPHIQQRKELQSEIPTYLRQLGRDSFTNGPSKETSF